MDINTKVENILKDAERFHDMLGLMPDNEYEIKAQLDQCKVRSLWTSMTPVACTLTQ